MELRRTAEEGDGLAAFEAEPFFDGCVASGFAGWLGSGATGAFAEFPATTGAGAVVRGAVADVAVFADCVPRRRIFGSAKIATSTRMAAKTGTT